MAADNSSPQPKPTRPKRKTTRRPAAATAAKQAKSSKRVAKAAAAPKKPKEERKPFWEWIPELGRTIPKEEWDKVPHDGSINYKHYLYGHLKKTLDD